MTTKISPRMRPCCCASPCRYVLCAAWLKIKVFTPAGTAKYFESLGVPGFLAYLTIAPSRGRNAPLLLGIETRWIAMLLVPLIAGTIAWCMENGLAIQQQRRRLGISGVLDRRPGPSCPSWVGRLFGARPRPSLL